MIKILDEENRIIQGKISNPEPYEYITLEAMDEIIDRAIQEGWKLTGWSELSKSVTKEIKN
jgi:hypothetical protein